MWVFGTSQKTTTTTTITKNKKKVHTAKSSIVIIFCFCSSIFFFPPFCLKPTFGYSYSQQQFTHSVANFIHRKINTANDTHSK